MCGYKASLLPLNVQLYSIDLHRVTVVQLADVAWFASQSVMCTDYMQCYDIKTDQKI